MPRHIMLIAGYVYTAIFLHDQLTAICAAF